MKINVAAIQSGPVEGDPEKTVARALDWLNRAAARDVKLAVFPEIYYPGYQPLLVAKAEPDRYEEHLAYVRSLAEPVPGPVTDRIGAKASEHGMHVVFSLLEKGDAGRLHNSSVLIGSRGEILNVHRKTILTPGIETPELTPGNGFCVTKTEIGAIGQLICADSSCPETSRILAIKGAQILCLCMGGFRFRWKDRELMDILMDFSHASRTRAVDNSVFLIAANQTCTASGFEFFGKSRIIDYYGDILALGSEGTDREELLSAAIDVDELAELPMKLISRRRPDIYREILLTNEEAGRISGDFLVAKDKPGL
jgi:predicted amidohydrolase